MIARVAIDGNSSPRRQDVDAAVAQDDGVEVARRRRHRRWRHCASQVAGETRVAMAGFMRPARVDGAGARYGQRHRAQQRLRLRAAGTRAAGEPVTGDRGKHRLDVFGQHHRPPGKQRPGAAGRHQQQSGPRRESALHSRCASARAARRGEQSLHIVEQCGRDVHIGRLALPGEPALLRPRMGSARESARDGHPTSAVRARPQGSG